MDSSGGFGGDIYGPPRAFDTCPCGASDWTCSCLDELAVVLLDNELPSFDTKTEFQPQAMPTQEASQPCGPIANDSPVSSTYGAADNDCGQEKQIRRLACPFFQHQPNKPGRNRSCNGPGFGSIPKLKEHIMRCHCPKGIVCERCQQTFDDHGSLLRHRRSQVGCSLVRITTARQEMLDDDQVDQLKKRALRNKSSVEKWNYLYRMIFRLDESAPIPSPYYETVRPAAPDSLPGPAISLGDSLREYACRPSVQRELRREIQSGFSLRADSAAIADSLVAMLPRLVPLLVKGYQEEQQVEQSAYMTPEDASTGSDFNNTPSHEQNLQALWQQVGAAFPSGAPFEQGQEQWPAMQNGPW